MTADERAIVETLTKSVADLVKVVRVLAERVATVEALLDNHLSHKLRPL